MKELLPLVISKVLALFLDPVESYLPLRGPGVKMRGREGYRSFSAERILLSSTGQECPD